MNLLNIKRQIPRCIFALVITTAGLFAGSQVSFAQLCDGTGDPETCTERTEGNHEVCAEDLFGGFLNCTANDVKIGFADNVRDPITEAPINSCINGTTFDFKADFHVETSGGVTRYDIGLLMATDGDGNCPDDDPSCAGDGARTGQCAVSQISATNSNDFFQADGETGADTCGDIDPTSTPQIVTLELSTKCTEGVLFFNDATGKCQATSPGPNAKKCVALPNIVTWLQNQDAKGQPQICDSPIEAGVSGTKSKCKEDPTFGIPVVVEDAKITVTKTANPTSCDEPGCTVTFTVKAQNDSTNSAVEVTTIVDVPYGDLTDPSNPNVTNNTCADTNDPPSHLYSGVELPPSGFKECTFDVAITGNAGDDIDDEVEVCADSASGGESDCDTDTASVHINDVESTPTLTKTATGFTVDVTYAVQVNNPSSFDTLVIDHLCDDKFGDITDTGDTECGAGPFSGTLVSTNCDAIKGTTIAVSSSKNCSFVGRYSDTMEHTNTVTGTVTDDDSVEHSPSNDASVCVDFNTCPVIP